MRKPAIGSRLDDGHPINDNVQGCWLFGEGPGGNALNDIGPRRRDMALSNMDSNAGWVGSPYGYSLDFDGSNDYAQATNYAMALPATLQLLFMVKATGQYYAAFSHSDGSAGSPNGNSGWRVGTDGPSNKLKVTFGGVADYLFNFTMTANQWVNLVVTIPGNGGTATAYILPEGGARTISTVTLGTMSGTPSQLAFGIRGDGSDYLNGRVAFGRLWNRVLSQDEAALIHHNPFSGIDDPEEDFYFKSSSGGSQSITLTGLVGVGIFGSNTIAPGPVTISLNSVVAEDIFGALAATSTYPIALSGLAAQAIFGSAAVSPGSVTIAPGAVIGQVILGAFSAALGSLQSLAPDSVAAQGISGSFTLTPGAVAITMGGLEAAGVEGSFTVAPGSVTLSLTGMVANSVLGPLSVSYIITPGGVVAQASLGGLAVAVGPVTITQNSIIAQSEFGTITVSIPGGAAQIIQNASLWIGLGIRM